MYSSGLPDSVGASRNTPPNAGTWIETTGVFELDELLEEAFDPPSNRSMVSRAYSQSKVCVEVMWKTCMMPYDGHEVATISSIIIRAVLFHTQVPNAPKRRPNHVEITFEKQYRVPYKPRGDIRGIKTQWKQASCESNFESV